MLYWANSRWCKTAYKVRTHLEVVEHSQPVAAPSGDVAALEMHDADEVGNDLIEGTAINGRAQEVDVAADASEILFEDRKEPARGIAIIVECIVAQVVTDERGQYCAPGEFPAHGERCLTIDEAVLVELTRQAWKRYSSGADDGRERVDEVGCQVVAIVQSGRQRDLLIVDRIPQLQAEVLAQREAEPQARA
jgi:hypothetical protein